MEKDNIRRQALIDGKVVNYDFCTYDNGNETGCRYLGKGTIFAINGINQHSKDEYHMWKFINA